MRRRVLEATPIIIVSEQCGYQVTRKLWRRFQALALREHTIAAGFAVLNSGALLFNGIFPQNVPNWLVMGTAIMGCGNLLYAIHGWRTVDQRTVAAILVAMPKWLKAREKAQRDTD